MGQLISHSDMFLLSVRRVWWVTFLDHLVTDGPWLQAELTFLNHLVIDGPWLQAELNTLGRIGVKLQKDDIRFERLDIDASLASKMFEDNR